MKYSLNSKPGTEAPQTSPIAAIQKLWPILATEKLNLALALVAVLASSLLNLFAPRIIGSAVDKYIQRGNFHGLLLDAGLLLGMYLVSLLTSYFQTLLMGRVGQKTLFKLRGAIFEKLQALPVAFFSQNKAGDLISRINNDTDKLNQFFSQALVQFIGNLFIMAGAAIFMVSINPKLGGATLIPAIILAIITQVTANLVKGKNAATMRAIGGMSAEIQESLDNFKVVVAFNRRDYFREKFQEANQANYQASVGAGLANNAFPPIYGFLSNAGQLIVLVYGIYLITQGNFTLGLLISYLAYVNNFYNPLRQLAALWTSFQTALAAWDRISQILSMESDLVMLPSELTATTDSHLLEFQNVAFSYPEGKDVLHDVNFTLEPGKTYALVGPTGGGKTTTASLMARLYDPTKGQVLLKGRDIRTYSEAERTQKIGFILQEPVLFTGTVRDNIIYGNLEYLNLTNDQLLAVLGEAGLDTLLVRFDQGLDTPVTTSGDGLSLGQKQLIAFIRAVLRRPEILILDEATANIDTVTEQLLEEILRKLPATTTRVIIAHRLNTIEAADSIYFVNAGEVTLAGSMEHAVELLLHGKRAS